MRKKKIPGTPLPPERTRPIRACTSRRLTTLSPDVQKPNRQEEKQVYSPPSPPPLISDDERCQLRNMWELACVINFFKTFFPILKLGTHFSGEALENAILRPNNLLIDIHVALLKGILPPVRTTVNRETWLTVLYKKLKDRWTKVAEGPCPVDPSFGKDATSYHDLDSATRLIILRALCECRVDQDDIREHMEESVKKGSVSSFRKERSAADSRGTTYWYEDGWPSGYRLYKEVSEPPRKEIRGRAVAPPGPGQWEVLATNVDEFRAIAETLSSSKNRQELSLSKKLCSDVLPTLEILQKKKEKLLKRQHRQAALLDNPFHDNGFTAGRARRERKQVTYTFAEFDRSINEAIKYTRKQSQSPDTALKVKANGDAVIANGHGDHSVTAKDHSDDEHPDSVEKENAPENSNNDISQSENRTPSDDDRGLSEDAGPSDGDSLPRGSKRDYDDEDEDIYSDDEIVGEVIYDDEFIRRRKRKKKGYASSVDEEDYNEDAEEDAAIDEDEDKEDEDDNDSGGNYSEEEDEDEHVHSRSTKKTKNGRIGLRRSNRTTKRKINYNARDSDEEDDEPPRTRRRARISTKTDEEVEHEPPTRRRGRPRIRRGYSDEDEPPLARGTRATLARGRVSTGSSVEDADSGSSGERDSFREDDAVSRDDTENADFSEEDGEDGEGGDNEDDHGKDTDSKVQEPSWNHVGNGHDDSSPGVERKEFRFLDLNQSAPTDSPMQLESDEAEAHL